MTGSRDTTTKEERIAPSYRPQQAQKSAPCQGGCPNCGDIRGWIGLVAQRDRLGLSRQDAYARAWATITDVNPFPATLGRICPHPCEAHCNRGEYDEPLAINAMERFLGDFAIQSRLPLPRLDEHRQAEWIGVVGAGPSGLSFAYQMARRGYRVTVYDTRDQAGGMLRYGVPDYRLPGDVLDAEIRRIVELGVELRLGTRVGRDVSLEELRSRHACLYLGIGAQKGLPLRVPGADGAGVWIGTDYLARVAAGETPELGHQVIVVGGGNSAVDAARCARRSGADVILLYRRTRAEMPAIAAELEDALDEGVSLVELAAPVRIERYGDGKLRAVVVQRMRLGEPDASGRRSPVAVAGSEFAQAATAVIAAISQVPLLDGLEGLEHQGNWLLRDAAGAVDQGVLAGGDAMGLGIAGEAIVQGRRAAETLHARLRGQGQAAETSAPASPQSASPRRAAAEAVRFQSKENSQHATAEVLPVAQRLQQGMAEVQATLNEETFLAEVQRCFSCGSCFGCEQCWMYCTAGCFTRLEEPRPGLYFSLNLDACQQCGKCVEVCPCGFLEVS